MTTSHKYYTSSAKVSRVYDKGYDYTTKIPRRGRHGNADVAFSSKNFLARAGLVHTRDYNIMYSRPLSYACARAYTLSHQTILFGDVLRWCVRPPAGCPTITSLRPLWFVRFPRAADCGVFRLEDFHPSSLSPSFRQYELRHHFFSVFVIFYSMCFVLLLY